MEIVTTKDRLLRISSRVSDTNGRRRERTVSLARAIATISEVCNGDPYSHVNGGSVPSAYAYPARTTVVMAARVDGSIWFSAREAPACKTSPGRAWATLSPWRKGEGPCGDAPAKWARWTKESDTIRLTDDEIEAALEWA